MEGVREEVPGLLGQILGGDLVVLEGLPDEKIRWEGVPDQVHCECLHYFITWKWQI